MSKTPYITDGGLPTAGRIPPTMKQTLQGSPLSEALYIRLPSGRGARCPITGASRSTVLEWAQAGLIKSIRIRRPGTVKGCVLIDKASVIEFLERLKAEQNPRKEQS